MTDKPKLPTLEEALELLAAWQGANRPQATNPHADGKMPSSGPLNGKQGHS